VDAGVRPGFRLCVSFSFDRSKISRLRLIRPSAAIHTPSCIWRRTGEIQKANQEFANLTGIPASMFRNGQLCVYELMDEDSAVRFWEGYAKIAFDAGWSTPFSARVILTGRKRAEIAVHLLHAEGTHVPYTPSPLPLLSDPFLSRSATTAPSRSNPGLDITAIPLGG
jgi:PAS domain-containing protein